MTHATTTAAGERPPIPQQEAARLIGVTDRTLRNWERRRLIVGHRPAGGGKKFYVVEDLLRLIGK